MRTIDLHCYPNTEPWIRAQGPYVEALSRYWHRAWRAKTEEAVVQDFKDAGIQAVLVAFDIETASGTPPCTNDYVAKMRDEHRDTIIQAWASVDPWKGEIAIQEATRAIRELGMLGFHFHPIMGHFSVGDRRLYPLWETINALKVPVMIDVGTTGMGAGQPGGMGARLKHARPIPALDDLAADFPDLTIVAAHPGWPWIDEVTAIVLHKKNVSWELSGWAPKYFPDALKKDIGGRLQDKIMFGSDYPSIPHERLFREWEELGYPDEVMDKVFHKNAERILGL
ncbi:MAG: amidohydrolase [Deltaproteobacteria bacterium]|nr:amidohydrolase [Deltaproteobacteria bacterium]MBI3079023.1 amidohydrolase [Deltaproteobacteria bacterium]